MVPGQKGQLRGVRVISLSLRPSLLLLLPWNNSSIESLICFSLYWKSSLHNYEHTSGKLVLCSQNPGTWLLNSSYVYICLKLFYLRSWIAASFSEKPSKGQRSRGTSCMKGPSAWELWNHPRPQSGSSASALGDCPEALGHWDMWPRVTFWQFCLPLTADSCFRFFLKLAELVFGK